MIKKTEQPWYKEWLSSPFYKKLYREQAREEVSNFLRQVVQRLNPSTGSRILVADCGEGEPCKILSLYGFDMTGVDLLPANVETAKKHENDTLHFFVHDLRLPFWINYFEYVFLFSGVFGYYNTRREHDDAIRTIAGSLKPGGILVMDCENLHFAEENMRYNETKTIGKTTFNIHRWDDERYFYKKIRIADPSLREPEEYIEKTMKFSLGDLTDMLAYQGLQVQNVFGDYSFGNYDIKKSSRLVIIAREKIPVIEDEKKRLYSDGRTTDALT